MFDFDQKELSRLAEPCQIRKAYARKGEALQVSFAPARAHASSGCRPRGPRASLRKPLISRLPYLGQLVQERLPVGWHPSGGSRCGLVFGMRVRRQQLHTLNHFPFLVVEEPVLTWLEAGYDRMSCGRSML